MSENKKKLQIDEKNICQAQPPTSIIAPQPTTTTTINSGEDHFGKGNGPLVQRLIWLELKQKFDYLVENWEFIAQRFR